MDAADAAAQISPTFEYMEDAVPNPTANPQVFQSCQDKFAGCCKSTSAWATTMRLVQQLEIGMENNKISGCCLMSFSPNHDGPSSSTDLPGLEKQQWYILGCEGKRPLCHILGQVEQYTMGIERALVPTYVKIPTTDGTELKHWHLQTSHEVLASYIKAHRNRASEGSDSLKITVAVHDYEAIEMLKHPNHFVYDQDPTCTFDIGTSVVLSRTEKRSTNSAKVTFRFGVVFDTKPKQPTSQKSKDAKGETIKNTREMGTTQRKRRRDHQDEAEATAEDLDTQLAASSEVVDDASTLSVNQILAQQDPSSVKLPAAAERNLQQVMQQLTVHQTDMAEAEEEDNSKQSASAASRPSSRFFHRTGLSDLSTAKKRMVCYSCANPIPRGEWRFEYHFSEKRPPRSVHTGCVGQISQTSIAPSLEWLKAELDRRGECTEQVYLQGAINVLQPLASLAEA